MRYRVLLFASFTPYAADRARSACIMRCLAPAVSLVLLSGCVPRPSGEPPMVVLNRAARNGDLRTIRSMLRTLPIEQLDLNQALYTAAERNRVQAMALLVAGGATEVEAALVKAARYNHVDAVAWLTSEERMVPAEDFLVAQYAASTAGSAETEWQLVALRRRRQLRDENERRRRDLDFL